MANLKFLLIPLLSLSGVGFLTDLPWYKVDHDKVANNKEEICFVENLVCRADSIKYEQIDEILHKAFDAGRFNGQVLYAEDGKILYNKSFGYENLKTKKELTNASVFQLASTSKPFTAIAILKLQEAGKLQIDMPVIFYLPDFPYKEVSVKNLLQHRSGLPNYINIADAHWPKSIPLTNQDLTPLLRKYVKNLVFTPDSRFQYSNTNYAYLATIVEKVSGKTFANYMQDEIFTPLGMQHSFIYDASTKNNQDAVIGYDWSRRIGFFERPCDFLDGVVGDKGIYSTAEDLYLFDQALYDYSLISEKSLDAAFTPAVPFDEKHSRDYGLGFRVKKNTDGQNIAYHNGWWKGFRTFYVHDYQNKKTLIWLNNRSDVTVTPYMNSILENSGDTNEENTIQGDFGSKE
ncbi:MAG: serine hydrolase domain-containing protein [Bacteroidales bacterium]